ncbi:FG-GAP-like repeat-containing protein [Flavivirga eckloniae]|uniref:ASPIC/UnbV domain-containing protein n=1 Tax=Flavivirga eckloniae TaxID=1803846 RepID=A0A2K9PU46_9FLAO|nr:FG-GAP-like repeat-containing protein [Flavivirga eckloniae]AUP80586.1 hypothetical protein C1H87_18460 [Flavivirga eckloniae]
MKNRKAFFSLLFTSILYFTCISSIQAQTFQRIENIVGLGSLNENNGVAVADYDGDLDLDIFIVAKAKDLDTKQNTKSKLYRNNSDGTFSDVTEASGLVNLLSPDGTFSQNGAADGFKYGVSWGDYDNDGFPDIFFTHAKKVQLFHNEGNGTFIDVTETAGIEVFNGCLNIGATWFDANNDGFLDLYICDWGACNSNTFYINKGDGTFENATSSFFGNIPSKSSFMSIPFDFNSDGWMDLYVSQDFTEPNDLFINLGGNTFSDQASQYGLDSKHDDMGMAIGDYNNDGFFDFYIATIKTNALLTNKGDNTFEDLALQNSVVDTGWSWGPIFADFDLDGDEDIFITNGFKSGIPAQQQNYYFKNLYVEGGNTFQDFSAQLNLNDASTSATPVAFDYDNDGDLDLFVTNSDKESHFYENKSINSQSGEDLKWFKVALRGTTSNRDAIGAIVSLKTDNGVIHRHNSSINYLSQSLKPMHFGLGTASEIQEITIKWPSGLVENHSGFQINDAILFIEGSGFSDYNIPQVNKKMGCTDPNSCTYDPEAIDDDGSCEYLASNEIVGNTNSGVLKTESYAYTPTSENSSLNWNITGGEIIEGHGTNSISVKWGITKTGTISVRETGTECSNELVILQVSLSVSSLSNEHSIARIWNEALLMAIRGDYARPTVHARNLFHTSVALYDSWALFDNNSETYLIGKTLHDFNSKYVRFMPNENVVDARAKAMSYAAYRLLSHRFKNSPSHEESQELFDFIMNQLDYSLTADSIDYSDGNAASLGNFIAKTIIDYGNTDGSRELNGYNNAFYEPVNNSLFPTKSGNPSLTNPNRWQPLSLNEFIDQSGNPIPGSTPAFLSPEWGAVNPFSLDDDVKDTFNRNNNDYFVYHDPSPPPYLDLNNETSSSESYKWGFSLVSIWGSHLDPNDNVLWDISPKSIGNIDIANFPEHFSNHPDFYKLIEGGDIGNGHDTNPYTNAPYEEQLVPRGDYARVLAEFWADGPDSETPPGHWFTLLNYVSDHKLLEKKLGGEGNVLDPLEWDVKSYFLLGGTMHDAAISAWSIKGWYDYIRPISAIRYMADLGQSSDMSLDNYNVAGIPLKEDLIEVVNAGDALEGRNGENIGKIKLYTWKGPDYINNPDTDNAGVGWILAENWWPYQRPSFVTPPFAGYVSGHSTYSRAAAEVMTLLTGSEYFPGGYGEFIARKNEFLVFEEGPSVDVKLQWATYRDASDQCSLSRIWGGIHPPADDIPGRLIGAQIGVKAFNFGVKYFQKQTKQETNTSTYLAYPNPIDSNGVLYVTNTLETDLFELVDMKGSIIPLKGKVFDSDTKKTKLNHLNTLSSGVYVLKINNQTRMLIKK